MINKKYSLALTVALAAVAAMPANAATSAASSPSEISLTTGTGFEVGGNISSYRYQEPGLDNTTGARFGVQGAGYKSFADNVFVKGDALFSYGSLDYKGSGKINGVPDYKFDIRATGGKDFLLSIDQTQLSLSPYAGLGYRNLIDDTSDKVSSTGAHGYYRDSQYLYLPVGMVNRFRASEDGRIATTIEYDQLLHGWQKSDLSDANAIAPDITNSQNTGYGFRASINYETNTWSAGPFFEYWNIDQSKIKYISVGHLNGGVYEPQNQTIEYGVKVAYKF